VLIGVLLGLGNTFAWAQDEEQEAQGAPPAAPTTSIPTRPVPPPPVAPSGGATTTTTTPAAAAEEVPEGERPLGDEEAMVLNFERAEIREVIHSLATALGISYTLDPRIEGQVTIRTTGRIPRDELFPLFNEILRNNGIAAVQVGDLYQILPVAEAKTRAIIPRTPGQRRTANEDDSFVIEIIQMKHVAAEEMQNILQPFITPGGDVLAYPRANAVVVTDLATNVQRLRELAATFDVDGFTNLHARVFKMKDADPEELANELITLLAPYGVTPDGTGEGGVFMVPLSRLNAIVVFAIDKTAFTEIDRWLAFLDIPPDQGSGRQTFVYAVENAKAVDLAAVLNELFGGSSGGGGAGGFGRGGGGAAPAGVGLFGAGGSSGGAGGNRGQGRGRSGSGAGSTGFGGGAGGAGGAGNALGGGNANALGGGNQGVGGAGGGGALGGSTSLGGGGGSGAGRGSSRRGGQGGAAGGAAGGVAAAGVSLPGGQQGGGVFGTGEPPPIFREEVRIVADEVTNSLITLATKRDYQLILDILRKIDVVPRQVVLEVMIAEIFLTKDLEFGIQWALSDGSLKTALPTSAQAAANIFQNKGGPEHPGSRGVGGFIGDAVRVPQNGAFAVITDKNNFNIFINALQGRTNVKMLSAPHIIAADNREAHILVGSSIPILTSTASAVLTGTAGSTVNSIQYRDTGKILTILPQVNSKGLVNLQVRQEVSAVQSEAFGVTNSPSFSTREAETTMVVQDGETVIIGGIIDDNMSTTRSGVPFLMDVPVLGRFFRTDTDKLDRTELLVTITPYVIRNREEAREITDDFTARIEGLGRLRAAMQAKRMRSRRSPSGVIEPPPPSVLQEWSSPSGMGDPRPAESP
jgi:general secretion pathway protein D